MLAFASCVDPSLILLPDEDFVPFREKLLFEEMCADLERFISTFDEDVGEILLANPQRIGRYRHLPTIELLRVEDDDEMAAIVCPTSVNIPSLGIASEVPVYGHVINPSSLIHVFVLR